MSQANAAPTAEQIEALAKLCATDRDAYQEFVGDLASPPATYNLQPEIHAGLVEQLNALRPFSVILDHYKRVITYGDKARINPIVGAAPIPVAGQVRVFAGGQAADPVNQQLPPAVTKRLLLIHGVLGMITEAIELAPVLLQMLTQNEFDETNLAEEIGDSVWYQALIEAQLGITDKTIIKSNVRKLSKRYKGGLFTKAEALNRDLKAEREELEKNL